MISAFGKRKKTAGESGAELERMIQRKYRITLHIDNDMVLQIVRGTKDFREFPLSGEDDAWSQEVMDAIAQIEQSASETETT